MSSNSSYFFKFNDDVAMTEYGAVYFAIALPLFPLFFVVMKAIYLKDHDSANITYKLMNLINFCQLGQAVSHLMSGPMLILPIIHKKLDVFIRIIGCTMNSLWIADFPVMTLLALCRILIFTNLIGSKRFPLLIKLILFLIITYTLFLIIVGSLTQNFLLVGPGWDYDFTVINTETFATLEIIISFTCLVISYFAYILMAYLIYAKKNLISCVHSRKNEIAILLQSTFVTTYITGMIFVWHQSLFTIVSFINMENQKNQAILNCCLILHCYVNPIMTLICNKSIRNECWKVLGFRKKISKRGDVVSKLSSIHPTDTNQI